MEQSIKAGGVDVMLRYNLTSSAITYLAASMNRLQENPSIKLLRCCLTLTAF